MQIETARPGKSALAGWIVLAGVIAFRYAEPIQDGDLFWHMAYARQMLDSGSLIVDHTIFSWTPASNEMIYCAWAAQLLLYGLWEWLGPWSLFALRYVVIGCIAAMAAWHACRAGMGGSIFTPLLLVLMVLTSYAGSIIKPELFSLLFLHIALFVYFGAKLARLDGAEPSLRFYLVPLLILVWVNVHGAFVLAAPLLIATAAGELLNARFSPRFALSRRSMRHFLTAWLLCGISVTLTPYGLAYPIQLLQDYVIGMRARPDAVWNTAHGTIFDPGALSLHFAEYGLTLGFFLAALIVLVARRIGIDWAVVALNVCFLLLFLQQIRTTYLWPGAVVYSSFYLFRAGWPLENPTGARWVERFPSGRLVRVLAVTFVVLIGARSVFEARYRPYGRSWMGFGISHINPVAEAEFVAASNLGPRMYNLFNSGGYLIWRLGPSCKVMTDQRSFPYLSWFEDQRRFTEGEIFHEFLRRYPADLALIDLSRTRVLDNFLSAPDWRLAYYGPVAAVFVREPRDLTQADHVAKRASFDSLPSPSTAFQLFEFAIRIGDVEAAELIFGQLIGPLRSSLSPQAIEYASRRLSAIPP